MKTMEKSMDIGWDYSVRWRTLSGEKRVVYVSGRATRMQAKAEAINLARSLGWTPRRWWQFWRWGDSRP